MSTCDGYERHRQLQQDWAAATLRALSRRSDLYLRAKQFYRQEHRLPYHSPHLRLSSDMDVACLRGISDGLALRILNSDDSLHQRLSPAEPVQALLFECLEQLRTESLADATLWQGVSHNLIDNFTQWAQQAHDDGLTESATGLLIFTVLLICWSHLNNQAVPEPLQDLLEATRAGIGAVIGTDLAGLQRHRQQQVEYAHYARRMARAIDQ
ncbi:MAG: hypothetical protein R3E95_24690, partial [Thiolinea sp.]